MRKKHIFGESDLPKRVERRLERHYGRTPGGRVKLAAALGALGILVRQHPKVLMGMIGAGAILDEEAVPFGIREFHFDAATGFWLNGRNFKIKGVCLHHDGGAFGAAVPLRVWERRLEILRRLGVNAIRTAHNPPAPEFLDLCDRMGFLVMDEMFDSWTVAKNPHDYHLYFNEWSRIDTRDIVRRELRASA